MRYGGDNRSRLLLVTLIVTSLFLITLDLRGVQLVTGLRSGTQSLLGPFQRAASTAFNPIGNFFSDVSRLGRTRAQLKSLEDQNAKLRASLIDRKSTDNQIKQLKSILNLAGTGGYKIVSAKVISQGMSGSFSQSITIDIGANAQLTRDMTVIGGDGLVGVVKEVYSSTALVLLESDPGFRVGVRIAGSQEIGILSGQGTDRATLQLLDSQSSVKVGDVLLARGSEGGKPFVPGVPVGVVTAVPNSAGLISQMAEVKFFTRMHALSVVAVVVKAPVVDPRDSLVPAKPTPQPIPTVTVYVTPAPLVSGSFSPSAKPTPKK
ncbi:MAG: rod shape-determining protein MreC [Actinobacteria bacterium]|nr:rod shape-determining protein MreC [Actinomycetota bacterium]